VGIRHGFVLLDAIVARFEQIAPTLTRLGTASGAATLDVFFAPRIAIDDLWRKPRRSLHGSALVVRSPKSEMGPDVAAEALASKCGARALAAFTNDFLLTGGYQLWTPEGLGEGLLIDAEAALPGGRRVGYTEAVALGVMSLFGVAWGPRAKSALFFTEHVLATIEEQGIDYRLVEEGEALRRPRRLEHDGLDWAWDSAGMHWPGRGRVLIEHWHEQSAERHGAMARRAQARARSKAAKRKPAWRAT
jgi:hypothetical protein